MTIFKTKMLDPGLRRDDGGYLGDLKIPTVITCM
jgi:hypothetical protein